MGLFDRLFKKAPKDQFAEAFLRGIKAIQPSYQAVYDKKDFSIAFFKDGKRELNLNLQNMFEVYNSKTGKEKEEYLQKVVSSILRKEEAPEDYTTARPRVLPKIMSRATISYSLTVMEDVFSKPEIIIPYQTLAEDLALVAVYDSPMTTAVVNHETLGKWGLSFEEALKNAVELFEAGNDPKFQELHKGVYVCEHSDSYDATRLLLTQKIRSLGLPGFPFAFVPTRDTLILTGSENQEGIQKALEFAEKASEGPYPITGSALILKGDHWEKWSPGPADPLYGRFHLLAVRDRGGAYNDQKKGIEDLLKKKGKDIFVASYRAYQNNETHQVYSVSVWGRGIPTILPKAEKIAFFSSEKETTVQADWDSAFKVVGEMMEPLEFFPPVYFVRDFPTPDQFEKMGLRIEKKK